MYACAASVQKGGLFSTSMADGATAGHTREVILQAAAQEVLEHGYVGASLSGIAGRLGLTKGALAYHFPTKDRILAALVGRLRETLATSDTAAVEVFGHSPARACVAFVSNVGYFAGTDVITAAAMSLFADPSVPREVMAEPMGDWERRVRAHLEAMVEVDGCTFDLDLADAAEFFIAVLAGTWMTARFFPRAAERPRLQFSQLALEAIGVEAADAIVADVLAAAGENRVQMARVEEMIGEHLRFGQAPPKDAS